MGLLTSVLNLVFVAAAGWFTIYYLVPKLTGESTNNTAAADNEETDIQKALEDTLAGLTGGDDTTTPPAEPEPTDKKKSSKRIESEKKRREKSSSSKRIESEKKRRAQEEYRYFYLSSGDYY